MIKKYNIDIIIIVKVLMIDLIQYFICIIMQSLKQDVIGNKKN